MIDFKPDFAEASVRPSPNFGERIEQAGSTAAVDMIVLHYTGMDIEDEALDWLCAPRSEVSAHYFIRENGCVIQMVPEDKRAWHAGRSLWNGVTDNNSRSIGIEIANPGHQGVYSDFPHVQMEAVTRLCQNCAKRWAVAPQLILGHSDIAPQRKEDPGEKFPWRSLFESGVGHWVEPAQSRSGRFFQQGDSGQPVEALQAMLSLYGYGVEITGNFDENLMYNVRAFQRHFRPERVDGVADISTIETLHRLLSALPDKA